ncbi:MAG: sulfite exporter TauE/SafE family protein [archaeon]|nr:sulfite exporter TauE/SafE family protein [archaeon]
MDFSGFFVFVLIGSVTGFLSGLFGIGGGSVRIPLLVFAGVPLINAFGINMFAIPFSSVAGAYVQRKNIDWVALNPFALGGLIGIVIATIAVGFAPDSFLAVVFFLSAILTIAGLYLDKISPAFYDTLKPTKHNLFFGAFFANILIGLRGGSGGTAFPPILCALHVRMHNAVATSLAASFLTSVAALLIYLYRGDILVASAVIVAFTGAVGSFFGGKISIHAESKFLKAGLATMVFLLALYVLYVGFA